MLEPAGSGQPYPRAFLRVGGASLAQHQLGLVLALDCQRLICMARGASPELIALQHAAEDAGLTFHIVGAPQQLSALVTATDELIVVSEGLFTDAESTAPLLEGARPVVLALPDDGAVAEGFERLDINHAAAGLMKIPGSLVERLHELPTDCDAVSALTRIALQSGVPMRLVAPEVRAGAGWKMVRSDREALAVESAWLRMRFVQDRPLAIADQVAQRGVLAFGSALLHQGNASAVASGGVVAVLAIAHGAAWFGAAVMALLLVGLAWVLVRTSGLLRGAERQAHGVAAPAVPRADLLGWLVDLSLVAVSVSGMAAAAEAVPMAYHLFPPLMLVLLVHLVPRQLSPRLGAWAGDRMALAALLAVAAAAGYLGLAVRLLALALVLAGIALPPRKSN